MAEFKAVTSADNLDQLRRKLKKEDYQPNGDSFLPDMVYNCIRKLSAFATVWVSEELSYRGFNVKTTDKTSM